MSGAGQAMSSYFALCSEEIVNAARLAAYVDHGLTPSGFTIYCKGCDGLEDILPCDDTVSPVPPAGYNLPELDPAPWYDPARPESKNFAGLLVTSVTMSAPYARNVTDNIGDGSSLGRVRRKGRQIIVHGWLIGKTCCATTYGLQWLTAALDDPGCVGGGCGACDLDFLSCCPNIAGEDACITDVGGHQYVRETGQTEYQLASSFFRRMQGVGVVDGPNVISCKGNSCGCGCGSLLEVEFTLQTESPYIYTTGETLLDNDSLAACGDLDRCDVNWVVCADGESSPWCVDPATCSDDPLNPLPALPPIAQTSVPQGPGGVPLQSAQVCVPIDKVRQWGDSTLNIDIFAGNTAPMRNVTIQLFTRSPGQACADAIDQCSAISTVVISYIPAGGTLHFSGERRTVTIECDGFIKSAFQSVGSPTSADFDWPDISCCDVCVCITSDCNNVGSDATVSITRVDRDL